MISCNQRPRKAFLGANHGERRARAYNGGLVAEPPVGPGAEPVVRGKPPLKLKLSAFGRPMEVANLLTFSEI